MLYDAEDMTIGSDGERLPDLVTSGLSVSRLLVTNTGVAVLVAVGIGLRVIQGTFSGTGTIEGMGVPTGTVIMCIGTRGKFVVQIGWPQSQFKDILTGSPMQT